MTGRDHAADRNPEVGSGLLLFSEAVLLRIVDHSHLPTTNRSNP
jgi:hypothetical protein